MVEMKKKKYSRGGGRRRECFLPLLHGGQGLVLLELLAPHDDLHTLLAESAHRHVCDSLCDLGTLVGMESIGILVSLRSLLLAASAARRLVGLVSFRHDEIYDF